MKERKYYLGSENRFLGVIFPLCKMINVICILSNFVGVCCQRKFVRGHAAGLFAMEKAKKNNFLGALCNLVQSMLLGCL